MVSAHLHLHLPSGLFPVDFTIKSLYEFLLSPICAMCPIHLIPLDLVTPGTSGISTNHTVPDFLQPPVTSSLLETKVFLRTLFSNALGQCSSLNVTDQVPHPYDTTGKITFCTFQSLYSYTQQMGKHNILDQNLQIT